MVFHAHISPGGCTVGLFMVTVQRCSLIPSHDHHQVAANHTGRQGHQWLAMPENEGSSQIHRSELPGETAWTEPLPATGAMRVTKTSSGQTWRLQNEPLQVMGPMSVTG
jgi:hypothetical protein